MHEPQKMCMMCMVLSPNCCAVTIFELRSRYLAVCQFRASQSKWQSVDLDLVKLAKKRRVCGQRYSEVTCAFSLIKFLTSVPF